MRLVQSVQVPTASQAEDFPRLPRRRTRLERFSDHSRNTRTEVGNRLGNADVMAGCALVQLAMGPSWMCLPSRRPWRAVLVEQSLPLWCPSPEEVAWPLIVFVVDPVTRPD